MRSTAFLAVAAAVAVGGLTAVPAQAAAAPRTRLFLHSASGSYAQDALGQLPYNPPPGSTATAAPPSRTTPATAVSQGSQQPGTPTTPTWSIPLKGTVSSVCLDLFVATVAIGFVPPSLNQTMFVVHRLQSRGATATGQADQASQNNWPDGVTRYTAFLKLAAPVDVTPDTMLSLSGFAGNNPNWTLYYDSPTAFSSVTYNLPKDKCVAKSLPAPKPAPPPAQGPDPSGKRLYLHSSSGSYADDARAGTPAPYAAPAGSTATTAVPARSSSATARSLGGAGGSAALPPGTPTVPTWSLPPTANVRNICLDLFIATTAIAYGTSPGLNGAAMVNVRLANGPTGTTWFQQTTQDNWPDGVARITKLLTVAGVEVTSGTVLSLYGNANNNPDWTLYYDSATHYSSISFNVPKDKCTAAALPAPKLPK